MCKAISNSNEINTQCLQNYLRKPSRHWSNKFDAMSVTHSVSVVKDEPNNWLLPKYFKCMSALNGMHALINNLRTSFENILYQSTSTTCSRTQHVLNQVTPKYIRCR